MISLSFMIKTHGKFRVAKGLYFDDFNLHVNAPKVRLIEGAVYRSM